MLDWQLCQICYSLEIKLLLLLLLTHKFRTNCMVTDCEHTSNGRLCPFCPVESFEHAQNFPPDGTDITGQGTDSPD